MSYETKQKNQDLQQVPHGMQEAAGSASASQIVTKPIKSA
jgi:hypothetical protein